MLMTLAKIESISWIEASETPPPSASAFVGELEIFLPMAGFINLDEETARLTKEIGKVEKDLTVVSGKLNNASFVDRAPADVVEKEKLRQGELTASLAKLAQQLEQLKTL